jgi:hypothetical protein
MKPLRSNIQVWRNPLIRDSLRRLLQPVNEAAWATLSLAMPGGASLLGLCL